MSCNNSKSNDKQTRVVRDTTITPANAYSELFLDSSSLEEFIDKEVKTDSIAHYMRNFYNSRNYSFAWFDDKGLTVQANGFWNAHDRVVLQTSDSSIYDRQLHEIVDTLLSDDTSFTINKSSVQLTELRFTRHVFQYIQYAYSGRVDPEEVQWHIPRRKLKPIALLNSFLNSKSGDWKPLNEPYRLLQKQLFTFRDIEKNGGWNNISIKKQKFKQGSKDSIILFVKRRLLLTGIYPTGDTTIFYDPELVTAVKQAEASYGLKQDGIIDAVLIKQLNIPVEERMKQMLVNLERMKWMPECRQIFYWLTSPNTGFM
jgi:murein L,D-transpeptidase YcbB/YkuD